MLVLRRALALLGVCTFGIFGLMMQTVHAAVTPPAPRPGTCNFFCANTPQANIPLRIKDANGVDIQQGSFTQDCLDACRTQCNQQCGSSPESGGCFAVQCTYATAPTVITSGASFSRSGSCGGTYALNNRTDPTDLAKMRVVTQATNKTANELNCRNASQQADRTANCVTGVCPGSTYCCAGDEPTPPPSAVQSCLDLALTKQTGMNDAQKQALKAQLTNNGATQMSCQRVCAVATRNDASKCISGGCSGNESAVCCIAGVGQPATTQNASCPTTTPNSKTSGAGGGDFGLSLPSCTQTGNCQLSDILATGVNFANFLFGLAGALFFAIMVYGGFRYVFFAFDSGTAQKSKEMIKNAMIGLLLMMMASLFVRFVGQAVRGTDLSGETCSQTNGPDFTCVDIHPTGNITTARRNAQTGGCIPKQCAGGDNVMCCPSNWEAASGAGATTPTTPSTPTTPPTTP